MSWRITQAYAHILNLIASLARRVPVRLGSALDDLAMSLAGLSRHLPPMPRESLTEGAPFIGEATCEDMDCRERWMLYSPLGFDADSSLVCPECGQPSGVVL